MWRCPHCGTPQAETNRCWACSRSPMTCSTCRNFRRGVAARLGYCALDKTRAVLTGEEVRACWQAPAILEPSEGLFESLNTLLAPKPAASLAMAGPGSQSVASAPAALPRTIGGRAGHNGGARPAARDDESSGVVPGRLREVPGGGVRARLARMTGHSSEGAPTAALPMTATPSIQARARRALPIAAVTPAAREGRLIEAPLVRPSRRIMSAADRMTVEGFRAAAASTPGPASLDLEGDVVPEDGPVG
jgi:hypothetical protein